MITRVDCSNLHVLLVLLFANGSCLCQLHKMIYNGKLFLLNGNDNFSTFLSDMKTPTVKQSTAPEKSTFLKKASQPIQKENTVETQNGTPTETPETEALPQTEGSGFCFNFKIDTEDSGGKTDDKKQSEPVENKKPEGPKPAVNYFKMIPTEGKADFKFNFTVE